jgi:Flp pilus assembly protein TadG
MNMTLSRTRVRLRPAFLAGGAERGAATLESVITIPVVFLIIFSIIQGALWWEASNVAHAAATTAYNTARTYNANSAAGVVTGTQFLRDHQDALTGYNVSVNRGADTVTVTVTGNSSSIIPGFNPHVTRTVTGPVETWVNPRTPGSCDCTATGRPGRPPSRWSSWSPSS